MINILLSFLIGAVSYVSFCFLVGGGDFKPLYGIVPGLIALVASYVLLARRTMQQVQSIALRAQQHLQSNSQNMSGVNPQKSQRTVSQADTILQEANPLGKRQFLVSSQIDGQIGQLYFMTQQYNKAEKYLKQSFKKNWVARAMLAVLYYKRK